MRGKAEKNGTFCPGVRITPAYAGKSTALAVGAEGNKDYPRVCGEKLFQ